MIKQNMFLWLQDWYSKQCNMIWEHSYGIEIETIDNPGWSVKIDLIDTPIEGRIINPIVINRSDDDWISCKIENNQFKGYGGAENLEEIIAIFKKWLEE